MNYLDIAEQVQAANKAKKEKEASSAAQTSPEVPRNKPDDYSLGSTYSRGPDVQLYGDLFPNLMVWVREWHELRLEHPGGVVLNAKPKHITDALERHPWGVVYDQTKTVFVTWGDVPRDALIGKRDLKTWVIPAPEREAV